MDTALLSMALHGGTKMAVVGVGVMIHCSKGQKIALAQLRSSIIPTRAYKSEPFDETLFDTECSNKQIEDRA